MGRWLLARDGNPPTTDPAAILSSTSPLPPVLKESDVMLLARHGLPPLAQSAYCATEDELSRVIELCGQFRADALRLSALVNSHRRINRLPREIMSEIFKWVRDIEGWRWLRLSLVCQLCGHVDRNKTNFRRHKETHDP